jgi:hypothetical protein
LAEEIVFFKPPRSQKNARYKVKAASNQIKAACQKDSVACFKGHNTATENWDRRYHRRLVKEGCWCNVLLSLHRVC